MRKKYRDDREKVRGKIERKGRMTKETHSVDEIEGETDISQRERG